MFNLMSLRYHRIKNFSIPVLCMPQYNSHFWLWFNRFMTCNIFIVITKWSYFLKQIPLSHSIQNCPWQLRWHKRVYSYSFLKQSEFLFHISTKMMICCESRVSLNTALGMFSSHIISQDILNLEQVVKYYDYSFRNQTQIIQYPARFLLNNAATSPKNK